MLRIKQRDLNKRKPNPVSGRIISERQKRRERERERDNVIPKTVVRNSTCTRRDETATTWRKNRQPIVPIYILVYLYANDKTRRSVSNGTHTIIIDMADDNRLGHPLGPSRYYIQIGRTRTDIIWRHHRPSRVFHSTRPPPPPPRPARSHESLTATAALV
uniref:Uncharacterized protein n=1 Tax=Sipha flava TaxID=143950 RepID=A0A2S2Q4M6_9HEMI